MASMAARPLRVQRQGVLMPDLIESGDIHFDGAVLPLAEQLALAQEQVNEQRETIANLPAGSCEAGLARMQLLSVLENIAFLRKLSSA